MIGIKWTPFNNSVYLWAQLPWSKWLLTTLSVDRGVAGEMRQTLFLSYWRFSSNDLRGSFGGIFARVNRCNEVKSTTVLQAHFYQEDLLFSELLISTEISLKLHCLAASEGTIAHLEALMGRKCLYLSEQSDPQTKTLVPLPIILSSQMAKW